MLGSNLSARIEQKRVKKKCRIVLKKLALQHENAYKKHVKNLSKKENQPNDSVIFQTLNLATVQGQKEPLIRDVELAQRLGYTKPKAIRNLIKKMHWLGFVQTETIKDSKGESETFYLLDETQTLMVCMKAKTKIATEIGHYIIDVVYAICKGKEPPELKGEARAALDASLAPFDKAFRQKLN